MTKQEFMATYGKSVYDVRLALAMSLMTPGDLGHNPRLALQLADEFIEFLLTEEAP